jgi:hypothetical protein
MAKKVKKIRPASSRNREKRNRVCRKLDKAALLLVITVLICMALLGSSDYDLSTTASSGFPALFLLVISYLPLELTETLTRLFTGHPLEIPVGWPETLTLAGMSVFMIAAVWAFIRFYWSKRHSLYHVQNTTMVFYLLVLWGIFQMIGFVTASSWNQGSVSPLLRSQQSRSAVVEKQ